ncbi:reverse transcriptase domain-containing protein [Tanacetum coccineum]
MPAKDLSDDEKTALIKVLKSQKQAIAWKLSNIKGINLEFCSHKILMEEDYEPTIQHQRMVNPKIHDVIKKEVEKLLDAGLIYPISDSPWVSPVHCVPKKGGMTVVTNDDNELVPTRLVTGWRVCIDYRKLNEATRKDHFPLPFMDQMLERLAGNEYYCFLDGFSGYFQILIDPNDQEKTTFTCPYGTFAYRRMPFGLCNAPGTFQRCMMEIFHDMIEKTMEVFMDDFSVFGNSFSTCLTNLEKMLKRCEDTNLALNWEKSHFMVKEGIVLGHKISKKGIEVDKAKIDVISKLPHPTTVKGIRSVMELENSQNNALAKLPMLKLGEYEMWEIRIKQYFQIQDYALWEVIENGNSWVPIPVTATESGPSTGLKMTVPSTAEEKMAKKNDVKARSLLLMALPNEHQLTFDQYVDAQSMFAAIKARFGGNEATRKTQKALLKQQLTIWVGVTPPEDLNVKFLRSLPSEWDTHVVVWMNKPDFDTIGLDDLYNNFKIVEQKVKKSVGTNNDDKNLAFLTTSGARNGSKVEYGTTKHEGKTVLSKELEGDSSLWKKQYCWILIIKENVSTAINRDILPENAEHQGVKTTKIGIKEAHQRQLEEFKKPEVNEYGSRDLKGQSLTTGCDKESDNSKENTDDSLKQQQKTDSSSVKSPLKVDKDWKEKFFCLANQVREEEPKKARENNDAPIIEDRVSDDEDDVEPFP